MAGPAASDIYRLIELLEETLAQEAREPDRVADAVRGCRQEGIDILAFDINRSKVSCILEDEQAIRIGFSLLAPKNAELIKTIVSERQAKGPFTSFQDFCERIDLEKVPDDFLTRAIQIGGFDSIEPSRARVFHGRHTVVQAVQRAKEEQASGQFSLFAQPSTGASHSIQLPAVEEWSKEQRIAQEEDAIGFSFEACLLDIEAEPEESEPQPGDDIDTGPLSQMETEEDETPLVDIQQPSEVEPGEPAEDEIPAVISKSLDEDTELEDASEDEYVSVTHPTGTPTPEKTVREHSGLSEHDTYFPAPEDLPEAPPHNFEEPPLPPFELTADDYEASFPDGIFSSKKTSEVHDVSSERPVGDSPQPQLIIQLSTLATTERYLLKLRNILQHHPGNTPVLLEFVDEQNQRTRFQIPADYAIDASEECVRMIASLTGYHAIKLPV